MPVAVKVRRIRVYECMLKETEVNLLPMRQDEKTEAFEISWLGAPAIYRRSAWAQPWRQEGPRHHMSRIQDYTR